MSEPNSDRAVRILVLFSDTGGGHRSAAEALREAWSDTQGADVQAEMVDVFRDYAPFPFNQFGPSYPWIVRFFSWAYAGVYHGTDTPKRAWNLAQFVYPHVRSALRRLLEEHPADLIVSVHPLFNHLCNWTMRDLKLSIPYVTVVTDLWTAHAYWFYPGATLTIVPTEGARDRALSCGVPADQIRIRGLPVASRITQGVRAAPNKAAVRQHLGLRREGRLILIVGGGDGMGPVEEMACAIDTSLPETNPTTQVVIITGRNAALRERLQRHTWRLPVRIEGFVRNMPEWMAASDLLVTKAGPGTITEGLLSGLPLVLMGKVPGQEDGNVSFVVEHGVGVWQPHPRKAAEQIREWLSWGNGSLQVMAEKARGLSNPNAAREIAQDIWELAGAATARTQALLV